MAKIVNVIKQTVKDTVKVVKSEAVGKEVKKNVQNIQSIKST